MNWNSIRHTINRRCQGSAIALMSLALLASGCDYVGAESGDKSFLELQADGAGGLQYCNDDGTCESVPNPYSCDVLLIVIDNISGQVCETCEDADGGTIYDSCSDTQVACTIVTAPEPDCVVCAHVEGAIFYSTCVVDNEPGDSCYSSQDCAGGERCSTEWGDCQSPPGCDEGQACPDVCTGVCEPAEPGCWSDFDCGYNQYCDMECYDEADGICADDGDDCYDCGQGTCRPFDDDYCYGDWDCGPGQRCSEMGYGYDYDDSDCGCFEECEPNGDCYSYCDECEPRGICVPDNDECFSDYDCRDDERCEYNDDYGSPETCDCDEGEDCVCGGGTAMQGGYCVPDANNECNDDGDCDYGERCEGWPTFTECGCFEECNDQGECYSWCSDCPAGGYCVPDYGDECSNDDECGENEYCQFEEGYCECWEECDGDECFQICPSCPAPMGKCEPIGCPEIALPPEPVCEEGYAQAVYDEAGCIVGYECVCADGTVAGPDGCGACDINPCWVMDCAPDYTCQMNEACEGECVPNEPTPLCMSSQDCDDGEFCSIEVVDHCLQPEECDDPDVACPAVCYGECWPNDEAQP